MILNWSAILVQKLRDEGIEIVEEALAQSVSGKGGDITVSTSQGEFHGTHLLMAVGRKVNTERLDLEAAGIAYDRSGIKVDAGLRTSNRRVYAIGDVAGGLQFTHVAGYHAGVVIRSMLFGLPAKAKRTTFPGRPIPIPNLPKWG